MNDPDWVIGDSLGLHIPAHAAALREGGTAFLTRAFRASGALGEDNAVRGITLMQECPGGSTGRKLLLSVAYEKPAAGLHEDLFVKFSRDFDNEIRDRGRDQMESEVRFGLLSRSEGFPIAVPACAFADYHKANGTGILITERIAFGTGTIERPHEKCMDYELPEPLDHYRVLMRALGRLAGAHKGGKLPESVERVFPPHANRWGEADRIRYSAKQLQNRVARFGEFANTYPQLIPENIRTPAFLAQLHHEVPRFLEHEALIKDFLYSDPDLIALCHWNANVDNAWFWRGPDGSLACGLLDWGRVGQINLAQPLWGCLSASDTWIWRDHGDELVGIFAREYHAGGGPDVPVDRFWFHTCLLLSVMGLAWLMDAPPLIKMCVPDLELAKDRTDIRFRQSETARAQLQMMTNFLSMWQAKDFGGLLDRLVK